MTIPPSHSQSNNATNNDLELLSAYLDNQLTAAERGTLERRLRADPALQLELEELRTVTHLLHDLESQTPPRSFTLDPAQVAPRRPFFSGWAWLGSAFAAVLVLALTVGNLPFDSSDTVQMNSAMPVQETPPQVANVLATSTTEPTHDIGDLEFSSNDKAAPMDEESAMAPAAAPVEEAVEEAAEEAEIALSDDVTSEMSDEALEEEAAADLAEAEMMPTPLASPPPANAPAAPVPERAPSDNRSAPASLPTTMPTTPSPASFTHNTGGPQPVSEQPFAEESVSTDADMAEALDGDSESADTAEVASIPPRPSAHSKENETSETSVRHQQRTALSWQQSKPEPSAIARKTAEPDKLAEAGDQPAESAPATAETAPSTTEATSTPRATSRLLVVLALVASVLVVVVAVILRVLRQRTE